MNRISRRSATEEADALLEAGRTQPVLNYDVELGLERHHDWLRSEAPLPEWASASFGTAATSWMPTAIKTLVSAVLVGGLGTAAWYAGGRSQPSAASVQPSSPVAERTQAVAPSVPDVRASDSEAWMATTPLPVPDHGLPSDPPQRRAVHAAASDKRPTRVQRARKEAASARAASTDRESPHSAGDWQTSETPARVEAAAQPNTPPSATVSAERATRDEVAVAAERNATRRAGSEPAPQAQAPSDLVEMQQVATAEQLLERSPSRALALVHQGDQRFARGYFQQERAYIAIMALIKLGRIDEARTRAANFAKQFPALPYGARIRSALEARESVR